MPDNVEPKVDEHGNPVVEGEPKPGEKPPAPAHPDSVPWTQYVGLKETARKAEETLKGEVETLKGQVAKATSPEEAEKLRGELAEANTKLTTTADELKTTKDATLTEKRDFLIKKGVAEDKVKDMSVEQMNGILEVLETYKPKADLGGGGTGGEGPKGSPIELARAAYESSNKK